MPFGRRITDVMLYLQRDKKSVALGRLGVGLMAAVLLLPACEVRAPDGGTARLDQAVRQGTAPVAVTGPRRITAAGDFRVSPAWSPSGRWLAVAGLRGQGLYLVPTDGGPERAVDVDHRGPWRWRSVGTRDVLCFGNGATADALDAETWEVRPPCAPVDYDAERGLRIHRVGGKTFYHNSRLGTVTVVQDGLARTIPLDAGAWGARVSPDGRYVAYCAGTLATAELLLLDVAAGRTRSLGPGAHPAWFPDGARLLYTVISRVERVGRAGVVAAADLHLFEVGASQSRRLEQAGDQAEVQPAVSPDGRHLAYADWRTGAIYLRPAPQEVTP